MERKDYAEKFLAVKNEILDDIRKCLGDNDFHQFKKKVFIHFVDGEVATTELCTRVEMTPEKEVFFHIKNEVGDTEVTASCGVFDYDCESFLDIIDALHSEIREESLQTLRQILERHGGYADFEPNNWEFLCREEDSEISHSRLKGLTIDGDNILVSTIWNEDNSQYDYKEDCMPTDLIVLVISHLKQKEREYNINDIVKIVKENGNRMDFDETFWLDQAEEKGEQRYPAKLASLHVDEDGYLRIGSIVNGDDFLDHTEVLTDEGVERLLAYVQKVSEEREQESKSEVYQCFKKLFSWMGKENLDVMYAKLKDSIYEEISHRYGNIEDAGNVGISTAIKTVLFCQMNID